MLDIFDVRACPGRLKVSTLKTTLSSLLMFSTDRGLIVNI